MKRGDRFKVKATGLARYGKVGVLEKVECGLLLLRFKDGSTEKLPLRVLEEVWVCT